MEIERKAKACLLSCNKSNPIMELYLQDEECRVRILNEMEASIIDLIEKPKMYCNWKSHITSPGNIPSSNIKNHLKNLYSKLSYHSKGEIIHKYLQTVENLYCFIDDQDPILFLADFHNSI